MMNALVGKRVVIFGGASGMGKGAAKAVFGLGATPIIVGRNEQKLKDAALFISPDDPSKVETALLDATDDDKIIAFFESQQPFDHLVCTHGPSAECSDIRGKEGMAKLREQFRIKYFSQLAAVSYGVDKIKQGGSIVLTTGSLSRRPGKGSSALAGCNAALEVMIKGLANDFGPKVRINCVSPGVTDTEIWDSMPPEVKAGMLAGFGSRVPLGRAGTIEDVGNAIALLLLAEWTTGCTLDCDGGATIRP